MSENKYVNADGTMLFKKKETQPDWMICKFAITPKLLLDWCKANPQFASEYKGEQQVIFQIVRTKAGNLSMNVDTWKPNTTTLKAPANEPVNVKGEWKHPDSEENSNLPF